MYMMRSATTKPTWDAGTEFRERPRATPSRNRHSPQQHNNRTSTSRPLAGMNVTTPRPMPDSIAARCALGAMLLKDRKTIAMAWHGKG